MPRVAVVSPRDAQGGVKTTVSKLGEGLQIEGFIVDQMKFSDIHPPSRLGSLPKTARSILSEVDLCKALKNYDTVIYMGSIAYLSHLLYFVPRKALFIHGFVKQEFTNYARKCPNLVGRMGTMAIVKYWQLFNVNPSTKALDFTICRCETSAEVNRVRGDRVLLPTFVLPREIEAHKTISEARKEQQTIEGEVQILCYLSTVDSPRLLTRLQVAKLCSDLTMRTRKRVKFILIDPLNSKQVGRDFGSLEVLPLVSTEKFIDLLGKSDLYLERCVDEELGNGAIESALLGIPIAKVTLPFYFGRQDYGEKEVILAKSLPELAAKMAEYCNALEYFKPKYSAAIQEFVTRTRSWANVKGPLLQKIM